jgi:hypothetical protein
VNFEEYTTNKCPTCGEPLKSLNITSEGAYFLCPNHACPICFNGVKIPATLKSPPKPDPNPQDYEPKSCDYCGKLCTRFSLGDITRWICDNPFTYCQGTTFAAVKRASQAAQPTVDQQLTALTMKTDNLKLVTDEIVINGAKLVDRIIAAIPDALRLQFDVNGWKVCCTNRPWRCCYLCKDNKYAADTELMGRVRAGYNSAEYLQPAAYLELSREIELGFLGRVDEWLSRQQRVMAQCLPTLKGAVTPPPAPTEPTEPIVKRRSCWSKLFGEPSCAD